MARTIVAVAAILWMGLGLFIREPGWVCLPLYGLFPGETSFTGSWSHLLALWCFVLGAAGAFAP
jgi:hypothetical protein